METIQQLIESQEFDCVGTCSASVLAVREEVRDMCASGKCHIYGTRWACPPACGEIADFEKRMHEYETCAVIQTVAELEDEFDGEGMMEAQETHKERIYSLIDALYDAGLGARAMVLSAGTCEVCGTCTYPDAPCRFPDKQLVSMEAAGLYVSEVCTQAGIPYNHGRNTIAYSSCVLY